MVTQAIKHWFSKLSAWWPWHKSSEAGYTQTVHTRNQGVIQESRWHTTMDGPISLPGASLQAIEDRQGVILPEERTEYIRQPSQFAAEESLNASHTFSTTNEGSLSKGEASSPLVGQHLAFLRYLVKRGIVNEGFKEGQIPDQYKR